MVREYRIKNTKGESLRSTKEFETLLIFVQLLSLDRYVELPSSEWFLYKLSEAGKNVNEKNINESTTNSFHKFV